MSTISYPSRMPLPQVDGFTQQSGQVFTVSEPADGPSRYRLDRVNPSDMFTANLILNPGAKLMLRLFYERQLQKGMRWFYMPLMYDNAVRWYLCHLREIPSFTLLAGHGVWATTLSLEVDTTADSFDSNPNLSGGFDEAESLPIIVQDQPVPVLYYLPDEVSAPNPHELANADVLSTTIYDL